MPSAAFFLYVLTRFFSERCSIFSRLNARKTIREKQDGAQPEIVVPTIRINPTCGGQDVDHEAVATI